jgi:nitrous oxide reductase accessory protein NosL
VLRSAALITATAATGCLGGTGAAAGGGRGNGESDAGSGDEGGGNGGFALEPVDYPDERCAVDARNVTEHPDWNAQVVHEDGERAFFCTTGCMGAYYTSPTAFGVSDADIAGLWVTDYATGETVDGFESYYLFLSHPGLVETPAGRNPLAFAEEERAVEFTRRFDEMSTGAVERFSRINLNRCVW